MNETRRPPRRSPVPAGLLLLFGLCAAGAAGCRSIQGDKARLRDGVARPRPPQGRVVHSDEARGYAIIDFDLWPEPGQDLRLVDADGVTGVVRVTERRMGSFHVVDITEGQPKRGDYVAATGEKNHAEP